MHDKDRYESREQAWIKHLMLEKYLEILVLKVGTKWKSFVYVDAFAGPWDSTSEDLSDTSFSRALAVLESCKKKLKKNGVDLPIRAIFLEKKKSSARRLISYAERYVGDVKIEAKCADFLDEIGALSATVKKDEFAFVLVDPTGFKDVTAPRVLAPLLQKRGVELMINLMWDHINRFWSHSDTQNALSDIFGEDRDSAVAAVGGGVESARCGVYTQRLRAHAGSSGGRLWASAFPVLNPRKKRTHYYLVYTTHSPTGLLTFSRVAESTWQEQSNTRAQVKLKRASPEGQTLLFSLDEVDVPVERNIDLDSVQRAWLSLLPSVGSEVVVDENLMARLLEDYSCLECDLQSSLKTLISKGVVENSSSGRARPKRQVHPEKKEKLRRLL